MRKGTGIFINYRRRDAAGHAGRLFDWLAARRGAAHVFMDVSGIKLGGDFAQLIDAALRRCEVVLVLIGPSWMASLDARRDDPQDWVRIEIERALELEVRIIPVLVGGAALPAAAQLPAALAPLVGLQSIELSDSKWESDRELLWQAVKPVRHWQLPPRERIRTGVFWAALVVLVV